MIADFVFPGEGPAQVIKSCKDLLDIDIVADDILDTFEESGGKLNGILTNTVTIFFFYLNKKIHTR